jgi:hypothetical protein
MQELCERPLVEYWECLHSGPQDVVDDVYDWEGDWLKYKGTLVSIARDDAGARGAYCALEAQHQNPRVREENSGRTRIRHRSQNQTPYKHRYGEWAGRHFERKRRKTQPLMRHPLVIF